MLAMQIFMIKLSLSLLSLSSLSLSSIKIVSKLAWEIQKAILCLGGDLREKSLRRSPTSKELTILQRRCHITWTLSFYMTW